MSHLVKQSQLKDILEYSWTKTKDRYDGAFKEVALTPNTSTEKKLKFTKVSGGTTVDINLVDYARLTDQNNFKQDVAADNVAVVNNSHIGTRTTVTSRNRGLGFRQLTTNAFKDGHVDHIKIYLGDNATGDVTFKVWAITKVAADRTQDRVNAVAFSGNLSIETVRENGQEKKVVNIPINKSYATETYFIVRSTTHDMLVVDGIDQKYRNDSVNLGDTNHPQDTPNSPIDWVSGANADGANTAIMYLYGRESIGSLSEKIDTIKSGQVLSVNTQRPDTNGNITIGISNIQGLETKLNEKVPTADLVATGGTAAEQYKVPKLNSNGKLDTSFIPEIAITRVKTAADEEAAKRLIGEGKDHLQTGDVVVLENTKKAYMYKGNNTDNFANDFLELTMGNGTVKSVNGGTPNANGNVVVGVVDGVVEGGATGITMSFGNGGAPVTVATYMTANEVQTIKNIFNS